jgi:hypothetical protein
MAVTPAKDVSMFQQITADVNSSRKRLTIIEQDDCIFSRLNSAGNGFMKIWSARSSRQSNAAAQPGNCLPQSVS